MHYTGFYINSEAWPVGQEKQAWDQFLSRLVHTIESQEYMNHDDWTWRLTPRLVDATEFADDVRQIAVMSRVTLKL